MHRYGYKTYSYIVGNANVINRGSIDYSYYRMVRF